MTPPDQELDTPLDLDFSDAELSALLVPGAEDAPAPAIEIGPSEELLDVTRRLSAQLLDVLAVTSHTLLSGGAKAGETTQLLSTLDSLRRLAEAARDTKGQALIRELTDEAQRFAHAPNGRTRNRFLARLRAWLVTFATHLGEDQGARLRSLVEYDPRAVPLFSELAALPGVGPKRLQRLFVAGLYAVDTVANANATELAAVTGLPRMLAEDIIERAVAFRDEEQRRILLDMRSRLAEFQRALKVLESGAPTELLEAAQQAIKQMQTLVGDAQLGRSA